MSCLAQEFELEKKVKMNDIVLSLKSLIFVESVSGVIIYVNFRHFCTFLDIIGSSMKIVALSTKNITSVFDSR